MTIFIISTSMNTFHWFVNGIWLSTICAHLSDSNFRSSSFQKKKSSPNENCKKFCAWWTFVLILKPNKIGRASVDSHMLYSKSMKKFVAILLNLVIAIFEKSSNEHFRRTSRGRIDENCSWGWQWRWSFNFPLSFRSIDLKFSLDKRGEIAIKRIPSIFRTNSRLRVFNFTASAKLNTREC